MPIGAAGLAVVGSIELAAVDSNKFLMVKA